MPRLPHPWSIVVLDSLGIAAALTWAGLFDRRAAEWTATLDAITVLSLFVLLWLAVANHIGVYRVAPEHNILLSLRRCCEAWGVTWGVAGIVSLTTIAPSSLSIWFVLGLGASLLLTIRCAVLVTPWLWNDARIRALVIGTHPTGSALPRSTGEQSLQVLGVVPFHNEPAASAHNLTALGTIDDLPRLLAEHRIELAVVSPSDAAVTGEVRAAFRACSDQGVTVHYFPSLLDVDPNCVRITWGADRSVLDVGTTTTQPKRALALAAKRVVDFVGSGIGLLALFPVFAACALAVKLTSEGPVFFRQERVGAGGRRFQCLKFRTMRVGAHAQQVLLRSASIQDGPAFKVPGDPRVTSIGKLLRKFSLDELPQLINVLFGDMSLVGPRPPIPTEVERYEWWQRRRVAVKPGLTCLWQVYGRNRVSFKRWVEMDLFYIDNWSLWMDLKLIAHTFHVVLRGTGM